MKSKQQYGWSVGDFSKEKGTISIKWKSRSKKNNRKDRQRMSLMELSVNSTHLKKDSVNLIYVKNKLPKQNCKMIEEWTEQASNNC